MYQYADEDVDLIITELETRGYTVLKNGALSDTLKHEILKDLGSKFDLEDLQILKIISDKLKPGDLKKIERVNLYKYELVAPSMIKVEIKK